MPSPRISSGRIGVNVPREILRAHAVEHQAMRDAGLMGVGAQVYAVYGGAAARDSVPVSSGGRYHPSRIGDLIPDEEAAMEALMRTRADAAEQVANASDVTSLTNTRALPPSPASGADLSPITPIRSGQSRLLFWFSVLGAVAVGGVLLYYANRSTPRHRYARG